MELWEPLSGSRGGLVDWVGCVGKLSCLIARSETFYRHPLVEIELWEGGSVIIQRNSLHLVEGKISIFSTEKKKTSSAFEVWKKNYPK